VDDYYAILGVDRDAAEDEIKRAFRKLARETHPDANPDDPHAEERFRKVAQAYEVLSDPARRAAYDRGGDFDMSDLFSSFAGIDDLLSRFFGSAGGFGFPFGGQPVGPAQGSDMSVPPRGQTWGSVWRARWQVPRQVPSVRSHSGAPLCARPVRGPVRRRGFPSKRASDAVVRGRFG
jgi:curved DNA-binding protein CbpA